MYVALMLADYCAWRGKILNICTGTEWLEIMGKFLESFGKK